MRAHYMPDLVRADDSERHPLVLTTGERAELHDGVKELGAFARALPSGSSRRSPRTNVVASQSSAGIRSGRFHADGHNICVMVLLMTNRGRQVTQQAKRYFPFERILGARLTQ